MMVLPILLCFCSANLLPPDVRAVWDRAAHLSALGAHGSADSLARIQTWARKPEGLVLRATLSLGAFADLHDPERMARADLLLQQAADVLDDDETSSGRYLAMLTLSQESFLASLQGSDFKAGLKGRKAASIAQDLLDSHSDDPDVQGVAGGYLFWKAQALGALRSAFGGDTREKGIAYTVRAAGSDSPLREIWRTSLLWIHFERKEYPEALKVVREGLVQCPGNRSYHQAEGDILFRMGRLDDALDRYRTSWREYARLETIPVNRQAAAGNLARIHFAAGRKDSAMAWLDTLDATRYQAARKWLPPSLVRELKPVREALGK